MQGPEILLFFILYSFIGWIVDTSYRSWHEKRFTQGSAFGSPLCPVYGFGALFLFSLDPFIRNFHIAVQILALAVILGAYEYASGVFSSKAFKQKLWDYSADSPWSLQGHTDPQHALAWGVFGFAVLRYLHPFISLYIK